MNRQSRDNKIEEEKIIRRYNIAGPANMFFENIRKMKGFRVKDETVSKICHILCKEAKLECPRPYYKNKRCACVKMDEHWSIFQGMLSDFDIEVEYEDPTKSRKKPKLYQCVLLGKEYELKPSGSFGKIINRGKQATDHKEQVADHEEQVIEREEDRDSFDEFILDTDSLPI